MILLRQGAAALLPGSNIAEQRCRPAPPCRLPCRVLPHAQASPSVPGSFILSAWHLPAEPCPGAEQCAIPAPRSPPLPSSLVSCRPQSPSRSLGCLLCLAPGPCNARPARARASPRIPWGPARPASVPSGAGGVARASRHGCRSALADAVAATPRSSAAAAERAPGAASFRQPRPRACGAAAATVRFLGACPSAAPTPSLGACALLGLPLFCATSRPISAKRAEAGKERNPT